MILLDTNVVSALSGKRSNIQIISWFNSFQPTDFYLCTPVLSEIAFGAARARIQHGQTHHDETLEKLLIAFEGRILPFSTECALTAGRFRALRESMGRPVAAPDMMIAAIAVHNNMVLATRNIRDFDGLDLRLVNPFEAV